MSRSRRKTSIVGHTACRSEREVKEALREANDPNAKLYTHEEVIQSMQERIDRARDKPC